MYQGFFESRPQELCKMCGKCCKVSTTSTPYEELKLLAEQNHEGAKDFLDIFEPYNSLDEMSEECKSIAQNIVNCMEKDALESEKNIVGSLTFYKCKYISEDNKCSIYQDRKELCDRFPSSPWAVVPPGCGYIDWLEEKREEVKQQIRKQKENIEELKTLLNEPWPKEQQDKIIAMMNKIENTVRQYEKYGANDW